MPIIKQVSGESPKNLFNDENIISLEDAKQKVADIVSIERTMIQIPPNIYLTLGELAEKIGDLFYDNLSEYLFLIGTNLAKRSQSSDLKIDFIKASSSIIQAWEICLPYMKDQSKIHPKHTKMVYNVFPEIVIENLLKLSPPHIKVFLFRLANKIYHDGLLDNSKGRTKLATHLFECSKILKEISLKL